MKLPHLTLAILFAVTSIVSSAQGPLLPDTFALEDIVVEKYYISGADDATASSGNLPEGSVTYRIYADLKPGYAVSALVGLTSPTTHPLSISVSDNGQFYNNSFGVPFGTDLAPLFFTVDELSAIDTYITMGAASTEHFGTPKYLDEDAESILGGSPTDVLQNEDDEVCLPLIPDADGFLETDAIPSINSVGIPADQLANIQTANADGSFMITDGGWFVPEGVIGTTEENLVLLGQFTTLGGTLEFSLNILVLIPEELQCNAIPSCQKESITFTATFQDGDSEYNMDGESNNVHYQRDICSYADDGSSCILSAESTSDLINSFSLFPNPSEDYVFVSFKESLVDVEYALFDASGRLLRSTRIGNIFEGESAQIGLSDLKSGVYFLKLRSGDLASTKKIIKR